MPNKRDHGHGAVMGRAGAFDKYGVLARRATRAGRCNAQRAGTDRWALPDREGGRRANGVDRPEARYERFAQTLATVKRAGVERLGFKRP